MNVECRLRLRRVWKEYVQRKVSELSVLSFALLLLLLLFLFYTFYMH